MENANTPLAKRKEGENIMVNRLKKSTRKLKRMGNNNLYELFERYLKESIAKDLTKIYKKEARLVSAEDPWAYYIPE
jgi:hypothetical protein